MPKKPVKNAPRRGGARPGAGRPRNPDGPRIVVSAALPPALAEALQRRCSATGLRLSQAIVEALRTWLEDS